MDDFEAISVSVPEITPKTPKFSSLQTASQIPFTSVTIRSSFWSPRISSTLNVTLPAMYQQMKQTGRWDNLKLKWKSGKGPTPHHFWDSDVAKWLEAACYGLTNSKNSTISSADKKKLEKLIDEAVDMIVKAQQRDGYINSYYTVVEPGKRFTNLMDMHELYCAGHLIESAIAHNIYSSSPVLLNAITGYVDLINKTFGSGFRQKRGYPGHQEIELALLRLYDHIGRKEDLELTKFFIEERGKFDEKGENYFDKETKARGANPASSRAWVPKPNPYAYQQAHAPIRDQKTVEGHSVRVGYWLTGAAHLARLTEDESLVEACKTLWKNMTEKKMYITGGIGAVGTWEGFGPNHYLPNNTAYAETCASISLIFCAHQMSLNFPFETKYSDVMELALYNGSLAGISLDGSKFFYENPLQVIGKTVDRSAWFECSCCPPNSARLLNSLGGYIYSLTSSPVPSPLSAAASPSSSFIELGEDIIFVRLYISSTASLELSSGEMVTIVQSTEYPYEGIVNFRVEGSASARKKVRLGLRIPDWAKDGYEVLDAKRRSISVSKNAGGTPALILTPSEYFLNNPTVTLSMSLVPRFIRPHYLDSHNFHHLAIARGPLIYCVESIDNQGLDLRSIRLTPETEVVDYVDTKAFANVQNLSAPFRPVALRVKCLRVSDGEDEDVEEEERGLGSIRRRIEVTAVPYFAWGNRGGPNPGGGGDMMVWIPEEC